MSKLDNIIDTVVKELLKGITDVPKDIIITERYLALSEDYRKQLAVAKNTLKLHTAEVLEYEAEVLKVIRGESSLNSDLLNKLYSAAKEKANDADLSVNELEAKINDIDHIRDSISQQFETIRSWADIYNECEVDAKKMILSRIMSAVKVRRDYELEIDFAVDFEQFGLSTEMAVPQGDNRVEVGSDVLARAG